MHPGIRTCGRMYFWAVRCGVGLRSGVCRRNKKSPACGDFLLAFSARWIALKFNNGGEGVYLRHIQGRPVVIGGVL